MNKHSLLPSKGLERRSPWLGSKKGGVDASLAAATITDDEGDTFVQVKLYVKGEDKVQPARWTMLAVGTQGDLLALTGPCPTERSAWTVLRTALLQKGWKL